MRARRYEHASFQNICHMLDHQFLSESERVDVGTWQSVDVSDKPEMVSRELLDVTVKIWVPSGVVDLQNLVGPNLPWAEDHFEERVSGEPLNPPPSHEWWPFRQNKNEVFRRDEKFSHTYPERFWPKYPSGPRRDMNPYGQMGGIRFEYGDLADVVELLKKQPLTRQAYLPVWFPEDTGVVHGERVPCTLGYHFIQRDGNLHCIYSIRSCDYMRHFRDDVYMAARLTQWVAEQIGSQPAALTMHITSFHVFEGDLPIIKMRMR